MARTNASRVAALGDDDLLTPDQAAALAERSTRTIRRAYGAGSLLAYRDGGGRGVRIRYGDLRDWLLREPAAAPPGEPAPNLPRPLGDVDPGKRRRRSGRGENLALLDMARARRGAERRRASQGRE